MAHLHHLAWWTPRSTCGAPKGGAAKLKAYVVAAQRASAGEAHGAGYLHRGASWSAASQYGCLAAEASEGALVALSSSRDIIRIIQLYPLIRVIGTTEAAQSCCCFPVHQQSRT